MCGLAGIVSNEIDEDHRHLIVSRMMQYIQERGPDEKKICCYKKSTFGFARLSIRELKNGSQPFYHKNKSTFSMTNGEIYNYKDIREELLNLNYNFKSQSDTEVILVAFSQWGKKMVQHFRGMFAFAIWNQKSHLIMVLL